MKYFLIGPYPPPLGGISVYVYRLRKLLETQGQPVEIVDVAKLSKLRKAGVLLHFIFSPSRAVFYMNGPYRYAMLALALRLFAGEIIFHDHSGRAVAELAGIDRLIFKLFLARVDECILVGEHLRAYYQENGFTLPAQTRIQNAFLPPPPEDEPKIWAAYDEATLRFIEDHRPLLVANAFQISFHQGVDLYGLDMCVELTGRLKDKYPNVGLLFALAEVGDAPYFALINRCIDTLGIRDHFHFMTGQRELWPLFKRADLMIRPTFVDGYPVSVAEALYLGCPTVASDVGKRAEGTVLFRNRDSLALHETVERILDETPRQRVL